MDLASSKGSLGCLDKSRTLPVKDLCLDTQGSRQPWKLGWELSPRDGSGQPVGPIFLESSNTNGAAAPQFPALRGTSLLELGGRGRNSCAGGPGYYLLLLFNSNVVKYSSLLERWCYALGLLAFLTRGRLIRIFVTWQNRKKGLHSLTYFPICFTDPSAKGLFQNWVLPLSPWGFELWVGPNCLCLLLVILHRLRNF